MVKKYFKTSLLLAVGAMLAWGLTSCEKNNNGDDEKELTEKQKEMSKIAEQYANHTINITYKNLAAETSDLYDKLKAAKEKFLKDPKSLTQAEVETPSAKPSRRHAPATKAAKPSSLAPQRISA